jgi:hypothetical protein
MIDPNIEYKETAKIENIDTVAYFNLFEKYIKLNLKGEKKMYEVDSTDQESVYTKLNGGRPIPGGVYTFVYGEPDKLLIGNNLKDYIDLLPIMFCYNTHFPDDFTGINFNMIPNKERIKFFKAFYDTFKIYLEDIERKIENNVITVNEVFIKIIQSGNGQELLKRFNKATNANFNYAFRKYKLNKVKQLRMIELSEWKYIPFYQSKETFKKINDRIIQSNYYKNI